MMTILMMIHTNRNTRGIETHMMKHTLINKTKKEKGTHFNSFAPHHHHQHRHPREEKLHQH